MLTKITTITMMTTALFGSLVIANNKTTEVSAEPAIASAVRIERTLQTVKQIDVELKEFGTTPIEETKNRGVQNIEVSVKPVEMPVYESPVQAVEMPVLETNATPAPMPMIEPELTLDIPEPIIETIIEPKQVEPIVCDEATQWYNEDYTACIDKPVVNTEIPKIAQVSTPQAEIVQYNQIQIPSLGITAPIAYAGMSDFFVNGDMSQPQDTDSPGTPVQNLMRQGAVHVPFSSPFGGAGNAYIVGHSSSPYGSGSSWIDSIFESLMFYEGYGQEIIVWDSVGVKHTYRIYEARQIGTYDTGTAYAPQGKPTITIQTCTYDPNNMWIVRAELI